MKVLVTGANGVVGEALCALLEQSGMDVVRAVRRARTPREMSIGELHASTRWDDVLDQGVDAIVHLAGKVPTSGRDHGSFSEEYCEVNTRATENLGLKCAEHGVKQFVFISTVKVFGEGKNDPYRADDPASPQDAYAVSKWAAEQALRNISASSEMAVTILRPPLVYGPGVKGNFMRIMRSIDRGLPLPVGAITNRRSLVFLGNLVHCIRACLVTPSARGMVFPVSDGEDVSTPELVRRVAFALQRRPLLVPVPVSWMKLAGSLSGRQAAIERLTGSLTVDITHTRRILGWQPPFTMQVGLAETASWFRRIGVHL